MKESCFVAFAKLKTYRNENQTETIRAEDDSQQAWRTGKHNEQVNIMDRELYIVYIYIYGTENIRR